MIKRILFRSLITLCILIVLCIAFLFTPMGFKFSIHIATHFIPGEIHYQQLDGTITGPLSVKDFTYDHEKTHLGIQKLHINWSLSALLSKKLHIESLTASGITYIAPKAAENTHLPTKPFNLKQFIHNVKFNRLSIPYDIQVDNALITDIRYGYSQDDLRAIVPRIAFHGTIAKDTINFHLKATLIKPQPLTVLLDANGSLKHYELALQIHNQQLALNLAGIGSDRQLTLQIDRSTLLGGDLRGQLSLTWYPALRWQAHLIANQLNIHTIQQLLLEKTDSPTADTPPMPKTLSFNLSTTGKNNTADLTIHSLHLLKGTLTGEAHAALDQHLHWQLQLNGQKLDLNTAWGLLPADNPWRNTINPDGRFPLDFAIQAKGQDEKLSLLIHKLQILDGNIQGTVNTTLPHLDEWQLQLKAQKLDINRLLSLIPNENPLVKSLNPQGRFLVGFNLDSTRDQHHMTLQLHALHILKGVIAGQATATLNKPFAWTLSLTGKTLHLGLLNQLMHNTVNMSEKSGKPHLLSFHITGKGTKDQLHLDIDHTQLFKGTLGGTITANRLPMLQWQANLKATQLNLSPIKAFLPNNINLTLDTQGQLTQTNDPLFHLNLSLTSNRSHVTLQVKHQTRWDATWDIHVPQFSDLLPQAKGSFISQGNFHGTLNKPTSAATLNANALAYGDAFKIQSIKGKWRVFLDQNKRSFIHLTLKQLKAGSFTLPEIAINAKGKLTKHDITANIQTQKDHLLFAAKGHFDGLQWIGNITQLAYGDTVLGPWHLSQPAAVHLSANKISIGDACVVSSKRGKICFGGQWAKDTPWQFFLKSHGIRFTHLTTTAGLAIKLTSTLTVDATATGVGKHIQKADVLAELFPGTLRYLVDTRLVRTPIHTSKFTLHINPKIGLKAKLDFETGAKDKILSEAQIPDFLDQTTPFDQKTLRSKLHLRIHDFRFVTILENVLKLSLGVVEGDFTANGPLKHPDIAGKAVINLPHFEYTTIGMKANNIVSHIHAGNQKITFDATGYALNKSPIKLTGGTDFTGKKTVTTFLIQCQNALIIYNNEMKVYADTKMHFLLGPKNLDIEGTVHIPKALLTPKGFGSGEETIPKGDVVYIGLPKKDQPKATGHKIKLHLKITMGKNVVIKVYGLRANLMGDLTLLMSPGHGTMGNGQIRIENGTFQAYGQYLVVDKGSAISYHNTPITSPALDVRAFKYINTTYETLGTQALNEQIKVGVHVSGTPTQLKFRLYSQPGGISQADILSYLVLGYASNNANGGSLSVLLDAANAMADSGGGLDRPPGFTDSLKQSLGISELGIRNETVLDALGNPVQQQSSFVVGQKLTRRIYIQFSHGIILPDNEFSIQYRLNPNWRLQGTAGSLGTGADILYHLSTD